MQILFAISILCFFAIAWAAIAFARHIKASSLRGNARNEMSIVPRQSEFRQHLYSAAQAETTSIRYSELHQNVRDITANKSWSMPPKSSLSGRSVLQFLRTEPRKPETARPKPPQSARHGAMAFLDPAYFNKDSGDLTDPYQPPRVGANDRRRKISSKRY